MDHAVNHIVVLFLLISVCSSYHHQSSYKESQRRNPRSASGSYTGSSGHNQKIDNHKSSGQYRVQLPDGRLQIVTYIADDSGYHAKVDYEGTSRYPHYQQHHSSYNHKPITYRTTPATFRQRSYELKQVTQKPIYTTTPKYITTEPITYHTTPSTYKLRTHKLKQVTQKPIYATKPKYITTKPKSYHTTPSTYKLRTHKLKQITQKPIYTTTKPTVYKPTPKPYQPQVTHRTTPTPTPTTSPSPYHYQPVPAPYKPIESYSPKPDSSHPYSPHHYSPESYHPDPYYPDHDVYQPHYSDYSHGPNPSRYGSRLSSPLYRSPVKPSLAPYKPLFVERM